jgi:hypothetical protein
MKTSLRPWYSEASRRWHCPKTGRFLAFSDARPRSGVFDPGEADLGFEMFESREPAAPAKVRQLERQRLGYHRRAGHAPDGKTTTGRTMAA